MKMHSYIFDQDLESALDRIKSISGSELTREFAYEKGVFYYNSGQYFEAHEVWEFQWKKEVSEIKIFFQILIQMAIALNKIHVRPNWNGAFSLTAKAKGKMETLLHSSQLFSKNPSILLEIQKLIESILESNSEEELRSVRVPSLPSQWPF